MPDVKDHAVVRQVKDPMHGDRDFDGAEIGGEMSAALGHLVHEKAAQLGAERLGVFDGQRFQRVAGADLVQIRILVFFHGICPLSNCTVLPPNILQIGQRVEISTFAHILAQKVFHN